MLLIQLMRFHHLIHIQLHAQARFRRNLHHTALDCKRFFGQSLVTFLPDPMGIDSGNFPRRRRRDMSKHRQRNIKVVVRVRAPGQPELMAHLRHANRTLHRPEVRIRQRDIHGLQRQGMPHLTPVGSDHIGRRRQPGSSTEFRHHFTTGEALLCAARIFRISQRSFQVLTNFNRFIQRPCAVGIERDARLWKAFRQRHNRFRFFFPGQYAAFQFEVVETIFLIRCFRQTHYRIRGHRLFMTQAIPVAFFIRLALIRQRRRFTVTNEEQIAKHFDFATLLTIAQQRCDVDAQMLT